MMETMDDVLAVLREIRDELRALNTTAEAIRQDVGTIEMNVESLQVELAPATNDDD